MGRRGCCATWWSAPAPCTCFYGAALIAEPLYVRDVLDRLFSTFAALQAVFGVGASGVTSVIYLGTSSLAVSFVGVALWGVCTALLSGPSRTLLQRGVPESIHGRVLATDTMCW